MEFGPASFGDLYADEYDALHNPGTTDDCVSAIADLAGTGKMLELAIGTGRIALPLAQRGLSIHGIEGSPDMVAKLRAKPGGDAIPVSIGDFADVDVDGAFDFVFLVFNTLFNLTSQAAQVRCFKNVAEHLNPGGVFLVETYVPDPARFINGQSMRAMQVGMDSAWIEAAIHDPVEQVINHQRIRITSDGIKLAPLPMRYAWPAELDLMAQLAGLELKQRWGSWTRAPFTADSKMHVSVYAKPVH